jgi:hypothetical protein
MIAVGRSFGPRRREGCSGNVAVGGRRHSQQSLSRKVLGFALNPGGQGSRSTTAPRCDSTEARSPVSWADCQGRGCGIPAFPSLKTPYHGCRPCRQLPPVSGGGGSTKRIKYGCRVWKHRCPGLQTFIFFFLGESIGQHTNS